MAPTDNASPDVSVPDKRLSQMSQCEIEAHILRNVLVDRRKPSEDFARRLAMYVWSKLHSCGGLA